MGCDIHAHVEIKVGGKWVHYNHPSINRQYALFAKMANVRNGGSIVPISDPRGLPTDITESTAFDFKHDEPDAHSMSWLSSEEVASLGEWAEKEHKSEEPGSWWSFEHHSGIGYLFGNGWDLKKWTRKESGHPEELEDARLVFWFDC